MDLEQELELVQELDEVESAEIKTDIGGISVRFKPSVGSYLEIVPLLKETVTDEEVNFYSNMTGWSDEQVTVLLEYK